MGAFNIENHYSAMSLIQFIASCTNLDAKVTRQLYKQLCLYC